MSSPGNNNGDTRVHATEQFPTELEDDNDLDVGQEVIVGKKLTSVYEVLIQGVREDLSGHDLYELVARRCKVSSDKRICRASLLAMSDARVRDRGILEHVYSLAADHRIRCAS